MEVLNRITNILGYYKANPGCDPNIYEYVDLCGEIARYFYKETPHHELLQDNAKRKELYPKAWEVFKSFQSLNGEIMQKLFNNKLDVRIHSPLYELIKTCYYNAITSTIEPDQAFLRELGGINLYIKQQKRSQGKNFVYSNHSEMERLKSMYTEYMETLAKSKKGGYVLDEKAGVYVMDVNGKNFREHLYDEIERTYEYSITVGSKTR